MNRRWLTVGHYFIYAYPVLLITAGAVGVFDNGLWLNQSMYLTILAGFYLVAKHDVSLCERCISEMPLDGGAVVAKHRWRWALRVKHASFRIHLRTRILVAVAILACVVFATVEASRPASTIVSMTVIALAAWWWAATYIHERLQPWCPWCRWGGGGDGKKEHPLAPSDPGDRQPSPNGGGTK